MTVTNLCNEVLENAIGVHRNLGKIEPLYPMDAVAVQAMEELLKYRAIGTVDEFKDLKENQFFNFDSPVARVDKKSYDKAIDDFVELFMEKDSKHILDYNYYETIREVAEQLKGEKQ